MTAHNARASKIAVGNHHVATRAATRAAICSPCLGSGARYILRLVSARRALQGSFHHSLLRVQGRWTGLVEKPPHERSELPAFLGVERAGNETFEFLSMGFRSRCQLAFAGWRKHTARYMFNKTSV